MHKVHKKHKKHNGASTWCKVENILKRRSWGFFLTKERYLQRSQSILSSGVVPKKEPGEEANPHSICKAELILRQIKLDYAKMLPNEIQMSSDSPPFEILMLPFNSKLWRIYPEV